MDTDTNTEVREERQERPIEERQERQERRRRTVPGAGSVSESAAAPDVPASPAQEPTVRDQTEMTSSPVAK